jgi:hypothetical protein
MSSDGFCGCAETIPDTEKPGVLRKILEESGYPRQITEFMMSQIKFEPSEIMATPNAERVLKASGENPTFLLWRHLTADWGELAPPQCEKNEIALAQGGTIASCYRLRTGALIFCATDGSRTHTGFFVAEEIASDDADCGGAPAVRWRM